MPYLETEGTSTYYEIHGSGEALLLVAGLASDSQSWLPVVEDLARSFTVILFDNQGVGRTRPMDSYISISGMADRCVLLLDGLGVERAHVLGHSMGGFIAQKMAVRYRHRLLSLVLAATARKNSSRNDCLFSAWAESLQSGADLENWFRDVFCWLFTERFFDDLEVVSAAAQYAAAYPYPQSPKAFANQVRAIAEFGGAAALPDLSLPILVLAGSEDILLPRQASEALAKAMPGSQFAVIPEAAHSIHVEQPASFCHAVREFLEKEDVLHA
jgi:pimeloyl-ACP methyl ester carboxylesterase